MNGFLLHSLELVSGKLRSLPKYEYILRGGIGPPLSIEGLILITISIFSCFCAPLLFAYYPTISRTYRPLQTFALSGQVPLQKETNLNGYTDIIS